jgi:asparagine synthase (glutamine-hydrolysing)
MRLCESLPRFPFSGLPLWPSIDALPSDCVMQISSGGIPGAEKRWWSAPMEGPTAEGAAEDVMDSLRSTINSVTRRATSVTADLSGGADSSSIVYILASMGVCPRTFHVRSVDDRVDDVVWARRAAEDLRLDHKELPRLGALSRAYHYVNESVSIPTDFPTLWWGSYGFLSSLKSEIADLPLNVHFTGIGGDELFGPLPAASWSIVREQGLWGVRSVRQLASSARQSFGAVLRSSMSMQTFEDAIRAVPSSMAVSEYKGVGLGNWFPPPSMGRVLSERGRGLAIDGVERVSVNPPKPLDGDRGRHQMLESLQFQGEVLAQINQEFGGLTQWHSPYLRRGVIEAASRVQMSERFSSNLMKPVLFAAMRRIGMPAGFFSRRVTGEYSADSYAEFFRVRDPLKEAVSDFMLAESGIIDVSYIRKRLSDPSPSPGFLLSMENLVSVERWLRRIEQFGVGI